MSNKNDFYNYIPGFDFREIRLFALLTLSKQAYGVFAMF